MKYTLYKDQEKTKTALSIAIKNNNKVLCYAPTGFGKTILSKNIIDILVSKNFKVLFTVPRIKLATQTKEKFGYGNLILGNKTNNENSNLSIGSLQSIYSRQIKDNFDFIFIDECHYSHNSKYINYIFETYPNSKIIGLSATPIDQDGYLLQGYDTLVNETTVNELISKKRLTDVGVYTSLVQPKTTDLEIVNGDYNQTKASEVLRENKILSNTITEWEKYGKYLKTLVFATDIKHANELKIQFNNKGYTANCVHSKMNENEIEKAYKDFNLNNIQLLINVDMATFGFDEPSITCLLFARPIKSLRLYKQMVGRGLRTYKNKTHCFIIDCANVIMDNGYPTDEIRFVKKPVISKNLDNLVKIERDVKGNIDKNIPIDRIDYLTKISSLFDLYSQKIYTKEIDFQNDVKTFLKRAGFYFWRQNSGKMFKDGRWIHFTDKQGLPDITLIYKGIYIGLELKMPKGRFTKHQMITIPEMIENKVNVFIIDNFTELFLCLENIKKSESNVIKLTERQKKYRKNFIS